jgi:hypothetical protein
VLARKRAATTAIRELDPELDPDRPAVRELALEIEPERPT